jgi:DNA polymerase-3 subunit epsilon
MLQVSPPPIHVIDFEGNTSSGILEYGIVTLDGYAITHTCTQTCAPTGEISAREIGVHGLEPNGLVGLLPFEQHFERFSSLRQQGVFAAHNASFEHQALQHTWPANTLSSTWYPEDGLTSDWGPWLDTCALCQHYYPGCERYNLGWLIDKRGLRGLLNTLAQRHCPPSRRKPHCALYDALAAALLLLELIQGLNRLPWTALLDLSARQPLRQMELGLE